MASLTIQRALPARREEYLQVPPEQLKGILDTVAQEWASFPPSEKTFDRITEVLPLEKIQAAIRTQYPEHVDALQTAKAMFQEANCFLEETQTQMPSTFRAKLKALIDTILSAIENILNAFGIAALFKPAENELHADMKGQKLMLLLSMFSLLSTILIPVVGPALVGTIVGATLLTIAALSLIFSHIKPAPAEITKGTNWTRQFQLGQLAVVGGRKSSLDEIAEVLKISKATKTHPMLIGKSGVGKTETVKAFVQAIERGDYPELTGKKVIYFNVADLVNHTEMFQNGNRILKQIQETVGRHSDEYIFVFDEIHVACQKKEHSAIADQLKTLLDGVFPFAIGITTEEDFLRDIHGNHVPFARRFKRISIDNTDPAQTLSILQKAFLKQAPRTLIETGALQVLFQKTAAAFPHTAPQPSTALKILSRCIQKTSDSQKSPLELRVQVQRDKIRTLYEQGALAQGNLLPYSGMERRRQVEALEKELTELEEQLRSETEQLAQLFQMRDSLASVKRRVFETAIKVAQMNPAQIAQSKEAVSFLFLSHFLAPALEARIRSEGARLGVKTTLNEALIDEVIQEEAEMERRVQQAIEQGRAQLQERTA